MGTFKRSASVQMRSVRGFHEDHQMKYKLILIGGVVARAIEAAHGVKENT
jgi:hypothetical protein